MELKDILGCATTRDSDVSIFRDVRFWLLVWCVNIGANPGFSYLLQEQISLVICTLILGYMSLRRGVGVDEIMRILFPFCIIVTIQALSISLFSINTTIHYLLKITMGVLIVSFCGEKFPKYFSVIIFLYALVGLICFSLNCLGIIIPFIPIPEEVTIDGGYVFRVYSIFYTQLYNPLAGGGLTLRNCGPFWEPGAYQGFLNLALWYELTMNHHRDNFFKFRVLVLFVSVLTTLSTGGFVALFVVIVNFFVFDREVNPSYKVVILPIVLILSFGAYESLDFMKTKIENDTIRTSFNFIDSSTDFMTILIGYGLSVESLSNSSMETVNSLFNLFNFFGILGFFAFVSSFWKNKSPFPFAYFIVVLLVLMNEPFLSNAPIFWGLAFVTYSEFEDQEELCESI